ncbi:ABC transporter ATP-binding protein [Rhizobium leguminosarum]|uniref:ATP-binding cassette domain-containing protein n=1 Tax=Rhizobium leguminosarum TaxID=384 RepID=A0A6P0DAG6_RHILE|nr:ABC transporter ATP-binding protein [Rhizobium leguminosarum]ASS57418.1 ABC transporter ATP-binding protein [Rhizobium leguminosarum bv. viciae]AVC49791.1 ABC transporter family protein [Rhizobium leguminosarum bv. viciae]MBB4327024.1 putative ABC transport system ATP-binding protein [Rhizobium leguminosarum]MBB4341281.1 putative ABC transport system ATP-binding protein [Rhizobium leguminosarum]MBB4352689.1 putative ABC transport system ATP-binding protein [Rhizobium leguminosarum]
MASPPLIDFRQVSKIYGEGEAAIRALDHVDLAINAHEFVAIMGPSGSGKSTAMNILGCLDVPSAGDYIFEGIPTSGFDRSQLTLLRRHMLGFVFQGFNLLSRTSAVENVELPLIYRGMAVRERRERAREALALVGLTGREHHKTQELSGGQQQRVAIARAIVTEPALLLADEPTGNLDTRTSVEIMDLMTRLNREQGITIVMVTHEPDIAAYAQRLLRFVDGKLETEVEHRRRADHVL